MKKRWIAAALAATLTVSLAACGSSTDSASSDAAVAETSAEAADSTGSTEAGEAVLDTSEENTIRFADNPGTIRYALVILADQLGYYEEEGVNVEFTAIQDATSTLTAISTGKDEVDVLGTAIVPDLTFIAGGSDLVIFEGTAAEGGAVIARPDEVETYKDLANIATAKAALVRNDSAWIQTRIKLAEEGLDPDGIELFEVDSEANVAQAVAKGEADIGFLPEEYVASYEDLGISLVYEVGELEPYYVCCRQVTSSAKLAQKYDAFVKFTKANLRAWEYYEDEANRESIDELLAGFSGQTADYVDNYLFVNKTTLTLDPNASGIVALYNELISTGVIDETDVKVEDHIDTSAYAQALNELIEEYPDDSYYTEKLDLYNEYNL